MLDLDVHHEKDVTPGECNGNGKFLEAVNNKGQKGKDHLYKRGAMNNGREKIHLFL